MSPHTNTESLRIAYLASEYPAISHTFIYREICALRGQGFDVITASVRRPANLGQMTPAERREGDETLYIKSSIATGALAAHGALLAASPAGYWAMLRRAFRLYRRWPLRWVKVLAYFAEAGVLVRWMRRHQAGHVHVHFANPAATVALIASAYPGIAFSLSVHGPDVFYNVDTNCLAEKVNCAAFVRCISYFCQSQIMRLTAVDRWPNFHIVRCGVDPAAYRPRALPNNAVPQILCVGRLVPAKGQHVLLQACRELHARGQAFHLTFVGDGPDRAGLEAATAEYGLRKQVTFAGAVGQDAVHSHYDRADLFVLASFAEGLPVVLMEAMAKEIACISTPIAAISELIQHDYNGLLVAPSDVDGLTNAIERLLNDPDLRARLGRNARERVVAEYDVMRNCEHMGKLFRQVAARPKRGTRSDAGEA